MVGVERMVDGYRDFEIRIGPKLGEGYPLLARGPEGERSVPGYLLLPFDEDELDEFLPILRAACHGSDGVDLTLGSELGLSLENLGRQLYDALFSPRIRSLFQRERGRIRGSGRECDNLRLNLSIPQPELARLPWEYLHDGQRFLSLDLATPIVRGVVTHPWSAEIERPLRLLLLGVSPSDQTELQIDAECRVIDAELDRMEERGDVVVRRLREEEVARDLPQVLWEYQPHILHFAGHGTLDSLLLEDGAGRSRAMSGTSLRDLLGNIRSLRLVVLNACELGGIDRERKRLGVAARLVQVGIPMAVAMQFEISDPGALAFSEGFYEALAQGMSLEAAVAWARVRISVYAAGADGDTMEWGTPVIHVPVAPWRVDWRSVMTRALGRGLKKGSLPKLPEAIVGLDGKEMRLVSAGPFVMGSDAGPEDERPQHQVRLDAYWIDAVPVTNAEYAAFVSQTAHDPPSHWREGQPPAGFDDHPASNVSCRDAEAYARWVGKRLPTEAEWEKAARGTDGRIWPWGNVFHPGRCRSRESEREGTERVGAHSPQGDSPYGVSDMAGNVWEWTSDLYSPYEGSSYRCDSYEEENQVLRGGSWGYGRQFCRCATRTFDHGEYAFESYGFRCVVDKQTLTAHPLERPNGDGNTPD